MGLFTRGRARAEPGQEQPKPPLQPPAKAEHASVREAPVPVVERPPQLAEAEDALERARHRDHWNWWLAYLKSTDEQEALVSRLAELIQKHAGPRDSLALLDAGSGEGSLSLALLGALSRTYPNATMDCVEQSPILFQVFKNRLRTSPLRSRVTVYNSRVERFVPDRTYDVVLSLNSVSGMDLTETPGPLERLRDAAGNDGLLLLAVPSAAGAWQRVRNQLARQPAVDAESIVPLVRRLKRWTSEETVFAALRLGVQPDGTDTRAELFSLLLREPFETAPAARRDRLAALLKQFAVAAEGVRILSIADAVFAVKAGLPAQEPPAPEPVSVSQEPDTGSALETGPVDAAAEMPAEGAESPAESEGPPADAAGQPAPLQEPAETGTASGAAADFAPVAEAPAPDAPPAPSPEAGEAEPDERPASDEEAVMDEIIAAAEQEETASEEPADARSGADQEAGGGRADDSDSQHPRAKKSADEGQKNED